MAYRPSNTLPNRRRNPDSDESSNQDVMQDDLLAEDDDDDTQPTPLFRASTRSRRRPTPEYRAPIMPGSLPAPEYRATIPEPMSRPQPAPEYRAKVPEVVPQTRPAADARPLRLVIAIDFGTTFTGVAFATPRSDLIRLDDIELVDDWGPNMGLTSKVPSVYSYSPPTEAGEQQWGSSLSPKAVAMVNTKLELDVQENKLDELELIIQVLDGTKNLDISEIKRSQGYPEYTWKSPEEIVTDYLTKIFQYLYQRFDVFGDRLRSNILVDIVVTVPVRWSYRAKNSTLRAIRKAGFNEQTFPNLNKMILVTEPEAAAIYTARSLKEADQDGFLKKNEIFVLCDAGGGTVDCVGYQVSQLEPTLELKEVTIATSERCGSTYIDKAFKRWLRRKIGDGNFRELLGRRAGQQISSHTLEGEHMRSLIKAFEVHKKAYPLQKSPMNLDLPGPLQHLTIPGVVDQGRLTISVEDMAMIFRNCIDSTIELIQGQIQQVERKTHRVRSVFLVGGFGESPFLQQELQKSLKLRNIVMRQPDKKSSWTAVVQGAVIYGVERYQHGKLSLMSTCSRSYAVVLDETNSVHHFDPRDRFTDAISNRVTAQKQLTWLVRRGDLILSDEKRTTEKQFHVLFLENGPRRYSLPVYVYPEDDDDVPDRFETGQNELKSVAVIEFDLSRYPLSDFVRCLNTKTGNPYYMAYLTYTTSLNAKSFDIGINWNGTQIGYTSIKDVGLTSWNAFGDDDTLSDY